MKLKSFRNKLLSRHQYEIEVGIAVNPQVPYIAFYVKGEHLGVVHFVTKTEWEEFKEALALVEKKAVFEDEKSMLTAKKFREFAKFCIKRAEDLEEEDC